MHGCMHTYFLKICMFISRMTCMNICVYVCMFVWVHTHISMSHLFMHGHMLYACRYVCRQKCMDVSMCVLTLMMPSSDFVEIQDYPYWLINFRWCRLLCASSHYIFFFSCRLPHSFLMAYLLFIEQDVGTHFYITEHHSIYVFSSLFIMIIYHKTKCVKETFIYRRVLLKLYNS